LQAGKNEEALSTLTAAGKLHELPLDLQKNVIECMIRLHMFDNAKEETNRLIEVGYGTDPQLLLYAGGSCF
jgi:hypothetical protein